MLVYFSAKSSAHYADFYVFGSLMVNSEGYMTDGSAVYKLTNQNAAYSLASLMESQFIADEPTYLLYKLWDGADGYESLEAKVGISYERTAPDGSTARLDVSGKLYRSTFERLTYFEGEGTRDTGETVKVGFVNRNGELSYYERSDEAGAGNFEVMEQKENIIDYSRFDERAQSIIRQYISTADDEHSYFKSTEPFAQNYATGALSNHSYQLRAVNADGTDASIKLTVNEDGQIVKYEETGDDVSISFTMYQISLDSKSFTMPVQALSD